MEHNNRFMLSVFHHNFQPSPHFEQQLQVLIDNRNMDSEENLELHIQANMILSTHAPIQQVKQLIRTYAKRGNYRFLKQVMVNLTNFSLQM